MALLFGYTKDNREVYSYTVKRDDLEAEILSYGGIIRKLIYKGVDVVLGYDTVKEYEDGNHYFGAIVGRYANRINAGKFTLNGIEYTLNCNDNTNHLHGGNTGFDKTIWNVVEDSENKLTLKITCKDGEEGYPGNLDVKVEYIIENNSIVINYYALSDKDTICNFTNHSYFNLNGHNKGDILGHTLKLNCSHYTPVSPSLIPTGEIAETKETPYDFTMGKKVGKDIESDEEIIALCKGYDVNFCNDEELCAVLSGDNITMEVYTNKPGVQLFSGNNLDYKGKENSKYGLYAALCLETQFYPDSINNSNFPSPVLKAGEEYKYYTIYKFL